MSRFVLDASVSLAWCFPDESEAYPERVLRAMTAQKAVVPSFWALEVANGLLVGERRGRLTPAEVAEGFAMLRRLPIEIDQQEADRAFDQVVSVARSHGLAAYDAAYLDLALRLTLPLATIDEQQAVAARALGILLFADSSS